MEKCYKCKAEIKGIFHYLVTKIKSNKNFYICHNCKEKFGVKFFRKKLLKERSEMNRKTK